jgi:hypothetical protein
MPDCNQHPRTGASSFQGLRVAALPQKKSAIERGGKSKKHNSHAPMTACEVD